MTELNSLKCFSEHKALNQILVVNCYLRLLLSSSQLWLLYFWSCLWGDSHEEASGLGIFLSWSCSSCFSIHLELYMKWKTSQNRWYAEGEKKKMSVSHKEMEGNTESLPFIFAGRYSNVSGRVVGVQALPHGVVLPWIYILLRHKFQPYYLLCREEYISLTSRTFTMAQMMLWHFYVCFFPVLFPGLIPKGKH